MAGQFSLMSFVEDSGKARYTFKGADSAALADAVDAFFAERGYHLEEGTPVDGAYGCGNPILRLLFGAFVKRYKFHVKISSAAGPATLDFSKAMSGAAGGVLGAVKMTKEYEKLREGLKSL